MGMLLFVTLTVLCVASGQEELDQGPPSPIASAKVSTKSQSYKLCCNKVTARFRSKAEFDYDFILRPAIDGHKH
jgi:hypothetical protein